MKKLKMYFLTMVIALSFGLKPKAQGITVCACNDSCTYIITVNIQACNFKHQCISLMPITDTISPDSCFTFNFFPPLGYSLQLGTASFTVSNTGNSDVWHFGTTSTDGLGNCHTSSTGSTEWTENSLTSYTICADTADTSSRVAGMMNINRIRDLKIYPNPSDNGKTTVEYYLIKSDKVSLQVYNMLEQKVFSINNGEESTGRHTLSIDDLKTGIYMVKLYTGNTVITKKLIVQ